MIDFNPCGAAVEWLRYPYTRKARLFNRKDSPLVDLVWYPTDKPFLPYETTINAKLYDDDAPNHEGLGEVWYPSVPKPNFIKGIPGLIGDHICGEAEQFLNGQGEPADPPTQYDRDHIPLCCRRSPAAQVTAGVRPDAIVTMYRGPEARVTSGVRPAALVSTRAAEVGRVSTGVRPEAVVRYYPASVRGVGLGVRPAAEVTFTPADLIRVTTGVRPAAVVEYLPALPVRVTAGVWPLALVASSVECQRESTTCGVALTGPLRLLCRATVPGPVPRWWRWDTGPVAGWIFRTGSGNLDAWTHTARLFTGNSCLGLAEFYVGPLSANTSYPIPSDAPGTRVYLSVSFPGQPDPPPVQYWGVFQN